MANKFQDLSPGLQMGIVAAVPAVLAVVAYMYWASPIAEKRDTLTAQVNTLKTQNQSNRIFDQQKIKNRARIAELSRQLETLSAVVPAQEDSEGFVEAILEASSAAGIHIRNVVAAPIVEHEGYTEEPFRARVDGAYYPMLDFFSRLAQGPRIVNVTLSQLMDPKGGGQGHFTIAHDETVGVDCVLTTYYNRPKAASPAAPAMPAPKR